MVGVLVDPKAGLREDISRRGDGLHAEIIPDLVSRDLDRAGDVAAGHTGCRQRRRQQ